MITIENRKTLNSLWKKDRPLMFQHVVKEIKKAVDENLEVVNLFAFKTDNTFATCKKNEYAEVLKNAMDEFVAKELYEDAAICRDLLRKITSIE